jgi:tetratricopeptide (TPR) repeat protein
MLLVAVESRGQTGSPTVATPAAAGQPASSFGSPAPSASAPSADPSALTILNNKVDSELKASREHLDAMRDAAVHSNIIFAVLGGILSILGIVSWLRQRSQDENIENRLKESDRQRIDVHSHALKVAANEEARRAEIHLSTMGLLKEHLAVKQEEGGRLPGLLDLQKDNMTQINALTTAIAGGANSNVEAINKMFDAIGKILAFKVAEAEDVQNTLKKIEAWREEREAEELQDLDELEQMAANLRESRHEYAKPSTAQFSARLDAYAAEFDRIGEHALCRLTKAKAPAAGDAVHGEIFLRRGTIAYYANNIVRARSLLRTADRFYTAVNPDALKADKNLARPCGFTKFYLALIEKNYGKMEAAKDFITASWDIWGKDNKHEFLTPAVKAEILSGLGDIDGARESLQPMLAFVQQLREQNQDLPIHEAVYVARSNLLLGDTYYIAGKWEEAEPYYKEALEASQRAAAAEGKPSTGDYYAQYALAQVYEKQGKDDQAANARELAHQALVESHDLANKKALDTQILLNALGYFCTIESNPKKAEDYLECAGRLWSRITQINGLELRLFSLKQKKQVPKEAFFRELFGSERKPVAG